MSSTTPPPDRAAPGNVSKTENIMTTEPSSAPAIYVGTYHKYNSGSLKGAWLNLEDFADREDFLQACAELHSDESDPEFMFQDYQCFPSCYYSESCAPPEELWGEYLDLDENDRTAFSLYLDNLGMATVEDFRDAYQGTADTKAEFAEQIAEDCGEIPKDLPNWIVIDWQSSWDCNLRFDYFTGTDADGTIHFFRNH